MINANAIEMGKEVFAYHADLYANSFTMKPSTIISGTYYINYPEVKNDRVRLAESKEDIGKHCTTTGWVKLSQIHEPDSDEDLDAEYDVDDEPLMHNDNFNEGDFE